MRQMSDHSFSSMAGNDEVHFLSFSCNRPRMQNFKQQKKINTILYMHTGINSVRGNKEEKMIG